MQTCYIDRETRSIADLVGPGELTYWWTITRIDVPHQHRRQGHATRLLQRILNDADKEGVKLALEPIPSGGMNHEQLVRWYEKHGFKHSTFGYMVRKPNGKE